MSVMITTVTAAPAELRDRVEARVRSHRTLVLLGAGVSMMPPSSLPSGHALLRAGLDEVLTDARARLLADDLSSTDRWHRLVPEVAFQRIVDIGGQLPTQALLPLAIASPNPLHHWLTGLSEQGARLVTTNFDQLLERTCPSAQVVHLHGDIGALETLVATIRRVGRGLSPANSTAMEALVSWAEYLLVIGYSGNDRDVMDVIEARPPAVVDWVVQSESDWSFHNMGRLGARREVVAIVSDLREVCRLVDRPSAGSGIGVRRPSWASRSTVLDSGAQHELLVGLYQAVDLHAESIPLAEAALAAATDATRRASIRVLLSHALNRVDRQTEALAVAEAALAEPTLDSLLRYRLLTERGLSLVDDVDIASARRDLAAALDIAESLSSTGGDDRAILGSALHNLAYMELVAAMHQEKADLAAAESLLVRAINEKRRAGDLPYLQTSLRNLAALLCALGRGGDAAAFDIEFTELAERYSLKWSYAYRFALEGWLRLSLGDGAGAVVALRRAWMLFEAEGDTVMSAKIVAALKDLPDGVVPKV